VAEAAAAAFAVVAAVALVAELVVGRAFDPGGRRVQVKAAEVVFAAREAAVRPACLPDLLVGAVLRAARFLPQ
jgi:hypothetical protein